MKLSVYNPTGSRIAIHGTGRFAGIVVRSLFAVRGHQFFDVASQEHADWLMKHIKASCPTAQVALVDDAQAEQVAADLTAATTATDTTAPAQDEAAVIPDATATSATGDAKKTGAKSKKTVSETKE